MKTVAWTLVICASVVIAGCGQKGPLYLPDKNASVVTRPGAGAGAAQPAPAQPQQPQDKDKSDDDSQSSKPKN